MCVGKIKHVAKSEMKRALNWRQNSDGYLCTSTSNFGFCNLHGFSSSRNSFFRVPKSTTQKQCFIYWVFYQMPQENLKQFLGRPDSCVPTYLQGDYVAQFFIMKRIYITYYYCFIEKPNFEMKWGHVLVRQKNMPNWAEWAYVSADWLFSAMPNLW